MYVHGIMIDGRRTGQDRHTASRLPRDSEQLVSYRLVLHHQRTVTLTRKVHLLSQSFTLAILCLKWCVFFSFFPLLLLLLLLQLLLSLLLMMREITTMVIFHDDVVAVAGRNSDSLVSTFLFRSA